MGNIVQITLFCCDFYYTIHTYTYAFLFTVHCDKVFHIEMLNVSFIQFYINSNWNFRLANRKYSDKRFLAVIRFLFIEPIDESCNRFAFILHKQELMEMENNNKFYTYIVKIWIYRYIHPVSFKETKSATY